jgi:hypothetical protein
MDRYLLIICLIFGFVSVSHAADVVPLAGDWRFETGPADSKAFDRDLTGTIKLPGTMDDAGLGPVPTKPPTLEGPYRLHDYEGPAWYQRDITIPPNWAGKRVTLFLERCRWSTTVWLDDHEYGMQDSLISPHVYDLGTALTPGKHRLTICVDNTVKLNLGRFVSALFGGTWGNMNGIVGRIELAATPPVWINDVQVYPDVDKKSAHVVVKIGNESGGAGSGSVVVGDKNIPATWDEKGGRVETDIDLSTAKLWDEFSPNLTHLTVTLGEDSRTVQFGYRKLSTQGTQFTMNGRPLFLRGTLECSIFPLTGYPPTDVPSWQRIFKIIKSYGLNFMRFHSWCPPEAAFEAADMEGVMLQVEGPQANVNVGTDANRDAFVEAEMQRIVDTYGNHPSFCLMTLGNEYGGKTQILTRWVDMLIQRDPRHLYSSASNAKTTINRQWTEITKGRGIFSNATDRDLSKIVASDTRPLEGHEIGQWMYWPNFDEIKKWTGVMSLKNFEMIRDDMQKKNLLNQEKDFIAAEGPFATLLYKEEVEVLLRTPGFGGFSLLDLHDYPTQGTAVVGPLDAFWDSKGFITPEQFRRYAGPTVPLLRMPTRTYSVSDPFDAKVDIAHFGSADLPAASPVWSIADQQGKVIAQGGLPTRDIPTGKLTSLGSIHASFNGLSEACKLTVTVALKGTDISNWWDIWVYPTTTMATPAADVVVCNDFATAGTALAAGKRVVLFSDGIKSKASLPGQFLPVFWSPVWFPNQKPNTMGLVFDPKQPLLARFPSDGHSDWQWFTLLQHSRFFILDDFPADYLPSVQVIDNFARNHKVGLIFEGRVGGGQLLVCGIDLPQMEKDPAARQMLASLYGYIGSAAFAPTRVLDEALLARLLAPQPARAPSSKPN